MKSLLLFISILMSSIAFGQVKISGIVTDEFGPMPNANVAVKNTKLGTSTNDNGEYLIKAKPTDTLRITHIGYEPVEILVGHAKVITTEMENFQVLDEVVVKAYNGKTYCSYLRCGFSYSETVQINARKSNSESIKLYPNPSKDGIFNINLEEDISEVNIIVADLTGRIIFKSMEKISNSKIIIDLAEQPTGIYIINLFSKGTQIMSKKAIRI